MTDLSTQTDKFGIYTYKPNLIRFRVENHNDWKHRELTIQQDYNARIYIVKLDAEILAERPVFTPDIFPKEEDNTLDESEETPDLPGEEGDESPGHNVLDEWNEEKWDKLLKAMFDAARTHSFCVVQLYNDRPYWRVFILGREIQEIHYNDMDEPISCKVEWDKKLVGGGAEPYRTHRENLTFYRSSNKKNDGNALLVTFGKPSGDDLGEYDLKSIWDLLIYLRYQQKDIVNNSAKTSGFYHFVYGDSISDDAADDLVEAGDLISSGTGIGAKKTVLEDIKYVFPAKPEFTVLAKEDTLKNLAGACRLPLAFFRSEREGGSGFGGTAGFIDEDLVMKQKKYVFSQFEDAIKTLVLMRWGIIIEDVKPYIQAEFESIETEMKEKANEEDVNEEDTKNKNKKQPEEDEK